MLNNLLRGPHGVFTSVMTRKNNCNPKGNPDSLTHEIGERHPSWRGGIQTIKRDGFYKNMGNGIRIPMARYVWIDAGRTYNKGDVLVHKDGDVFNNDIDNLLCMTRAQLIKYNK